MLARRIRATGRQATVLHLPGNGTGSLIADAGVLNAAVTRALRGGAPSVDVIGYSAGGVTALLWARDDGGTHKARRVITLGSPFHGADAGLGGRGIRTRRVPGRVPAAGARQQAAQPAWTRRPCRPGRAGCRCGPPTTQTVTPPDSARLAGALNVPLQSVCPAAAVSHSQLPTNPAVTAMVLRADRPGPSGARPPTAAEPGARALLPAQSAGPVPVSW